MSGNCQRRVRPLYDWEITEARQVFGDSLRYRQVRIHECSAWTDGLDRLGRKLKKLDPLAPRDHNAVTLGFHVYFPINLPTQLVPLGDPDDYSMPWLIHELTHVWQFQHTGPFYIVRALIAQFRYGKAAYDFGGPANLQKRRLENCTWADFNPEQQGDIARDYYNCKRSEHKVDEPSKQNPLSAYQPYINDLKNV